MKIQDAIEVVNSLSEGRAKRLDMARLLILEVQRICARKRYWWRRKSFTFSSAVGTATYDLTSDGGANADDFAEMIHLVRVDSVESAPEIVYESDPQRQQDALVDTSQGEPARWFINPGTSQTVRLTPVPNAVKTYRGLYWASPNLDSIDPTIDIPLIPVQFHYVAVAALARRVFFYLFGQNDPRYVSAEQDFLVCMADLDHFSGPATREAHEFRSSSGTDVVRATS